MSLSAHMSDDRLLDLAAGLVPREAAQESLSHLASCPECEGRFRWTCTELERGRLRAPRRAARPRFGWVAAAIAAVLLLGVLSVLWREKATPTPSDYWFPLGAPTVGLRTGSVAPEAAAFEEAAAAYRAHDPERMVALLAGKEIPESQDPLRIALASAYVKTGRSAKALDLLEKLRLETIPQPDRDRARWIQYAAFVAAGKTKEAQGLAAKLASRPGEFREEARRLPGAR